jgi:hypothetical protein
MSNRHHTTIESQAVTLRINPDKLLPAYRTLALEIMLSPPEDRSKWFTKAAVEDYQLAFQSQLPSLQAYHLIDKHSRQLVMNGPPHACWLSTQVLTKPNGKYHILGYYRSLDKAHVNVDAAVQLVIGGEMIDPEMNPKADIEEITLMIGSFHSYVVP